MKRSALFAIAFCACGGSDAQTVTLATPQSLPTTTAPAPTIGQCALGPQIPPIARASLAPPTPGQMTEEAARAKRLYDAERWQEALVQLERVASGESGDDEGNKQLAAYHVGAALYRMNRFQDSYAAFRAIARDRNHLKHRETVLWLTKIALDHPELVDFADFDSYDEEDILMFNNPAQREVYWEVSYLVGRAYLRSREIDLAASLFSRVPLESTYGPAARACLRLTGR